MLKRPLIGLLKSLDPVLDNFEYPTDAAAQAAYVTSDTGTDTLIISQTLIDGAASLGDDGGLEIRVAQGFKYASNFICTSIKVTFGETAGSPSGQVTAAIVTDSDGLPSGTLVDANATKTFTPTASAENTITFPAPFVLNANTTYWIRFYCDDQATDNRWRLSRKDADVYADGAYAYSTNGGSTWQTAGVDLAFKVYALIYNLQSYSESTIKTQGSYSLKGIAAITNSLNKTLTRTVSPTIDLTGMTRWKFDVYALRTGSNIKVSLHDSGGVWTETTPNVLVSNEFQTVDVDISAVADADKDAIDQIKITIVNADANNVFYIDNMFAEIPAPTVTGIDPDSGPTAGGTEVTITGTNFISGATVTIGGNPATDVVVVSDTTITATTPAGTAGAKDVVVTTAGGQGTLEDGFTYEAPPEKAAYRAQKGLISGYHCFMKQYIDFTKLGLAPLKLPDGTLW